MAEYMTLSGYILHMHICHLMQVVSYLFT